MSTLPLWRVKQANKAGSLLVLLLSVGGIGLSDCACPPGFSGPDGGPCTECTPGTYIGSSLAILTCSGNCLCAASNNISSGNIYDGPTDYGSNTNCQWLISSSAVIELDLTSLETEPCCDFVTINRCSSPSCSSTTTEQVARLSSSLVSGSSTYLSSTGYLQVVFTSDSSVQAAGFSASWKTTHSECLQCPAGKHSTSSQGISETSCLPCPVLPRNAFYSSKNDIPCSWTCERNYVSNGTSCLPCPVLPRNAYYSSENGIACRNWTCGQNYFSDGTSCLSCPVLPRNAFYSSKNDIPCSWTCERDYVSNGTSCLPCPVLPRNAYYSSENGIACRNWTCGQNYFSDGTSCLSCPVLPRNAVYNGNNCSWTCGRDYFLEGFLYSMSRRSKERLPCRRILRLYEWEGLHELHEWATWEHIYYT
jgi:hypothetical protein